MTLPLIHALTILHGDEREELESIITNFDDSKFERLIQLLEIGGSINYSEILVNNHLERASNYLEEFDDCDAKNLLQFVVSMVKNRNS
jgi:geranylgeranyl pyrophosphate synthase